MWPIKFNLAWVLLVCQLAFVICTADEDHLQARAPDSGAPRIVTFEKRVPVPISTWTSFITVTITTTLGQPGLPTTPPPPFFVTVPAPTGPRRTRTTPTPVVPSPTIPLSSSASSIPDSTSIPLATSTLTTSTLTTSTLVTSKLTTITSSLSMAASVTTPESVSSSVFSTTTSVAVPAASVSTSISTPIFSASTMSTIMTSTFGTIQSSSTNVVTPQSTSSTDPNNATALPPWLPKPEGTLYGTQVAAIVAGVVSFLVFIVLLAIFLRYQLMQHRHRAARHRQQLDMAPAAAAAGGLAPAMAGFYSSHGTTSSGTGRTGGSGSLRGGGGAGEIRIVIQSPSSAAAQVWSRGLWPSPPGYDQRFTFHSGRSTTTDDDAATAAATATATTTTDRGQWSLGTENGSVRGPPRFVPPRPGLHPVPAEKECPPYQP